jgi:hypothetical protein
VATPSGIVRGADGLERFLRENDRDVRALDLAGFRDWLGHHLRRWERDPVFRQRLRIRDLRRGHPRLALLEAARGRAREEDAASPAQARLLRLEKEVAGAAKAIAGLSSALEAAAPAARPALRAKLDDFRDRHRRSLAEHSALARASPERRALDRASAELERLRAAVGLGREEEALAALLRGRGRRSGRSGAAFEELALGVVREHLLPELVAAEGAGAPEDLRVLRGVTLGAPRTELDQVVTRGAAEHGAPVAVLAVVEAKRNVNDVAHGLRLRAENLAWLAGCAHGHDPADYRSGRFPDGRFTGTAEHREGGETFVFAPASFRRFRDAAGRPVPDRLYLVARAGPLWGLASSALARLAARVATDERLGAEGDDSLGTLFRWCRGLAGAVEAPDVLRELLGDPADARRVLLLDPAPRASEGDG